MGQHNATASAERELMAMFAKGTGMLVILTSSQETNINVLDKLSCKPTPNRLNI
jgi:hypothetical protein